MSPQRSENRLPNLASSYDLDNASITTENFYSNENGAGIKGHIEADSGKIGQWQIDLNMVVCGLTIGGETCDFRVNIIGTAPMIGLELSLTLLFARAFLLQPPLIGSVKC